MAIRNATLTAMREGLMSYLGEWYGFTTPGAGGAAGASLIDATNLPRFADDSQNGKWCLLPLGPSGAGTTEHRKISDFVQSTGTITPLSAFSAQVQASVGYEILRYHPTELIRWALNKALQEVYKGVRKDILNEALITGNALPNSDFEDFAVATAPDFWALVGAAATCAQSTTAAYVYSYRGSASLTRAGTDCYIHCSDVQWRPLLSLQDQTVDFKAQVYATVASRARLSVYINGVVSDTSSYHTGGSTFELLTIEDIVIPNPLTAISFRFEINTGNTTAYIDRARVLNSPISELVLPSEFTAGDINRVLIQQSARPLYNDEDPCDDPGWVYQPYEWNKYEVKYDNRLGVWLLSFKEQPTAGYKIRLEGTEPITKVTNDTDTVPLNEGQLNMLYPYAAYRLFTAIGENQKALNAMRDYELLKRKFALPGQSLPFSRVGEKW